MYLVDANELRDFFLQNWALGLSIVHMIFGVLVGILLAAAIGNVPVCKFDQKISSVTLSQYGVGFAFGSLILPSFGLCGICFKNTCLIMTYAVIAVSPI